MCACVVQHAKIPYQVTRWPVPVSSLKTDSITTLADVCVHSEYMV